MNGVPVRWIQADLLHPSLWTVPHRGGAPGMSGHRWLAAQDHAAMMQCVGVDEIAVGGETRVVPVLDMRPVDLVAALIGSLALTAGLDVPSRSAEVHGEHGCHP